MDTPIIETNRFRLRPFLLADAQSIFKLNSDPEVIRYTGDPAFIDLQEAETFLKNYSEYQIHGMGRWAVVQKSDHEFVGWCGLKLHPLSGQVDLGFRYSKKYWGQGFATECALACIKFGFTHLGLTRIIGRAQKENIASIKVLKKAGMHFEKDFDFDGNEGLQFSILKKER